MKYLLLVSRSVLPEDTTLVSKIHTKLHPGPERRMDIDDVNSRFSSYFCKQSVKTWRAIDLST